MTIRTSLIPFCCAALLAACGPRSETPTGTPILGSPPSIFNNPGDSFFPNPSPTIEGVAGQPDEVVFAIPYTIRAFDRDANLRWIEIDATYNNGCLGEVTVRFTEDVPLAARSVQEASISGPTVDKLRISVNCYPADNLFLMRARVRDFTGLLSINSVTAGLTIGVGQGSGGGSGN